MEQRKVNIVRIDSETIIVDYILCKKYNGVYCPTEEIKLGANRQDALFDFIKKEREKAERDLHVKAELAVNMVLAELNFKYKLN